MNSFRSILLAFAVLAVLLVAALLYTLPRRPPTLEKAKLDFMLCHRECSIDAAELAEIEQDRLTFRIKYHGFASNVSQEEVFSYRRVPGRGWQME